MFDRLFMAELWCNMLLSLFCTVRFVLGMDLFLVSRFLSLGSVSCFFLFFRFRCSLPWLSLGCFPFFSPSFSCSVLLLFLFVGFLWGFVSFLWIDSLKRVFAFYDPLVLMERSRSPRRFSSWPSSPDPRVILPVQNSSMATSSGPSWYPANGWSDTTKTTSCSNLGQPGPTILLGQRWKSNLEFYDYQKVNGLPLPRLIQPSVWSQSMKIAGFDPLTLYLWAEYYKTAVKTSGWGYWPLEGKFTLLLWEKWTIVSLWLRSFLNFAAVALIWLK